MKTIKLIKENIVILYKILNEYVYLAENALTKMQKLSTREFHTV